MNNNEWGVTERGFRRPTYTELLDALEYKAREMFGAKANLTVRSPLGVFLRIFAWMLNILFQLIEDVYNSRFVDTAVGTSLYNLGKAIGLRLLPAQKAAGYLQIIGKPGTVIRQGFLAATIAGLQYAVVAEVIIDPSGGALAPIQAFYAGVEYNTAAGTITQIVNPTDGVTSIENPAKVDGGRGRETDEQFRDRYSKSVDFAGGVNAEAIAAEILQTVESVYSALPYENDTDFVNEISLPPHSVEIVVYGGLDFEIAQAIKRRKSAGIQTYGNVSVPVITASGQVAQIRFSRPSPVPVWVRVTNLVKTAIYPENGDELIKQAIVAHIGGDVAGGLPIGSDVLYMAIPAVILAVAGVKDFDLEIGDGSTFSRDNIRIGIREKATTDEGKVIVG